MSDKIKIQITQKEWFEFPKEKRERVKEIMAEKGYDIGSLVDLEEEEKVECPYCDGNGCGVCEDDI